MDSSAVPKVSVIIPLYNKAPYIKRALDSVFAQTVQDFEIVVVGGNSTDGGEDIVLGYSDPRIRFVKESGKGVSAARNQGVDAARAELVAFLDADDEWLPEFLETILRLREKWPEAGIYTTAWYDTYLDSVPKIVPSKCYGIPNEWEGIISNPLIHSLKGRVFPGRTSSTCVQKDVFSVAGKFREDSRMHEDTDMWARIVLYYPIAHTSKPMVYYTHEDMGAATRRKELMVLDIHPFQKSHGELSKNGRLKNVILSDDEISMFLDGLNIDIASRLISVGNNKEARRKLHGCLAPSLRKRKCLLYCYSFIPKWLVPYGMNIYHTVRGFLGHFMSLSP